jgi:hypothetical protein
MDNMEGFQERDGIRTSWYRCMVSAFHDMNGMRGREQGKQEKIRIKNQRTVYIICGSRVKFETRKCHCSGGTNLNN